MAIGNLRGRARFSARSPSAMGECDRCGFWYLLDDLRKQFEWAGAAMVDTGYLVCPRCTDRPFEQNRTIILPPDPVPRTNPRPSAAVTGWVSAGAPTPTTPGNQGFSQYVLGGAAAGQYPTDPADVLDQVAALSGVPTPASIYPQGTVISAGNVSMPLIPANPNRTWLLLYNPAVPQAQVALGSTAVWGPATNLILGPGEAYFWAAAQGLGAAYPGVLALIGLTSGVPFWVWSDTPGYLLDGYGNFILDGNGNPVIQ